MARAKMSNLSKVILQLQLIRHTLFIYYAVMNWYEVQHDSIPSCALIGCTPELSRCKR